MGDIGHNGASRSENIQKQATAEEIQEAMMRKMDIKKQKAGNISKIRPQHRNQHKQESYNGKDNSVSGGGTKFWTQQSKHNSTNPTAQTQQRKPNSTNPTAQTQQHKHNNVNPTT